MTLNLQDFWVVYETLDEGGRRGDLVGIYDNYYAGSLAAEGRGWEGGNGEMTPIEAMLMGKGVYRQQGPLVFTIDDINKDKLTEKRDDEIRRVLDKLSDDEIRILKGKWGVQ